MVIKRVQRKDSVSLSLSPPPLPSGPLTAGSLGVILAPCLQHDPHIQLPSTRDSAFKIAPLFPTHQSCLSPGSSQLARLAVFTSQLVSCLQSCPSHICPPYLGQSEPPTYKPNLRLPASLLLPLYCSQGEVQGPYKFYPMTRSLLTLPEKCGFRIKAPEKGELTH